MIIELAILIAVLADIAISLYAHRADTKQQQDYRDEELELLQCLADAMIEEDE